MEKTTVPNPVDNSQETVKKIAKVFLDFLNAGNIFMYQRDVDYLNEVLNNTSKHSTRLHSIDVYGKDPNGPDRSPRHCSIGFDLEDNYKDREAEDGSIWHESNVEPRIGVSSWGGSSLERHHEQINIMTTAAQLVEVVLQNIGRVFRQVYNREERLAWEAKLEENRRRRLLANFFLRRANKPFPRPKQVRELVRDDYVKDVPTGIYAELEINTPSKEYLFEVEVTEDKLIYTRVKEG